MTPNVHDFLERSFGIEHKYDPVKAHEYYIRTRDLKGRTSGKVLEYELDKDGKKTANKPLSKSEAKKAKKVWMDKEAQDKVDKLAARFKKLQEVLAELTKQKSSLEGDKKDTKDSKSKDSNDSKPEHKTASEKKKEAKAAKERREKEGDPSLSAQAKSYQAKIKDIGVKIKKMRAIIAKAKAKKKARQSKNERPRD